MPCEQAGGKMRSVCPKRRMAWVVPSIRFVFASMSVLYAITNSTASSAGCWLLRRNVSVCLCVVHGCKPRKNGWTDRYAIGGQTCKQETIVLDGSVNLRQMANAMIDLCCCGDAVCRYHYRSNFLGLFIIAPVYFSFKFLWQWRN